LVLREWKNCSLLFWRCLAWLGGSAIAVSYVFGVELWFSYLDSSVLMHCMAVALACVGLQALQPGRLIRICFSWLARMGQLSYELYLTHMLVVIPAVAFVQTYLSAYAYWYALMLVAVTALCCAFARLVNSWISVRLTERFFPRSQSS
jgi:peptidoglycan/LPS O-acetylase OafA/YrhL